MQNIDVTKIRTVDPNRSCNAKKTDFQVERKNVFAFDFSCVFLFSSSICAKDIRFNRCSMVHSFISLHSRSLASSLASNVTVRNVQSMELALFLIDL